MKLIVSGKTKEFTPELEKKLSAKLAKLGKFIEQRGEREAHIMHQMERHLHRVEVVINFYDHALVGEGNDADLETALTQAIEKLEKQIVKVRERWRDTHRDPNGVRHIKENGVEESQAASPAAAARPDNGKAGPPNRPKIFHVNYDEDRKPMTLEEAMLEIERDGDSYVVYRDAGRNCLSVLVRRPDGNFDLIES
jgi:putative sigma-54 modulation protein